MTIQLKQPTGRRCCAATTPGWPHSARAAEQSQAQGQQDLLLAAGKTVICIPDGLQEGPLGAAWQENLAHLLHQRVVAAVLLMLGSAGLLPCLAAYAAMQASHAAVC
jgi:membrane-bound ClpP family serine protease